MMGFGRNNTAGAVLLIDTVLPLVAFSLATASVGVYQSSPCPYYEGLYHF
jgi:hypothetical protein